MFIQCLPSEYPTFTQATFKDGQARTRRLTRIMAFNAINPRTR